MTNEKLSALLTLLDKQIVKIIIEKRGISDKDAIKLLYGSKLYAALEDENTKLWHLSAVSLYNLLDEEIRTGTITYPEE
jgi:hypothetical protein